MSFSQGSETDRTAQRLIRHGEIRWDKKMVLNGLLNGIRVPVFFTHLFERSLLINLSMVLPGGVHGASTMSGYQVGETSRAEPSLSRLSHPSSSKLELGSF